MELLLSYGADVNLVGPDGRSALRAASWAGHEEIVQRLLDAGANVNQQDAEGRSSLIAAAYMGHVGVVEILAQAGELMKRLSDRIVYLPPLLTNRPYR